MSLVPTAASKKMMLSQIASKQAENGERAGSPDVLRCSSQVHTALESIAAPGGRVARALCQEMPSLASSVLLFREMGKGGPAGE